MSNTQVLACLCLVIGLGAGIIGMAAYRAPDRWRPPLVIAVVAVALFVIAWYGIPLAYVGWAWWKSR